MLTTRAQTHTLYLIQLGSNCHSCWYSYSLIALAGARAITATLVPARVPITT